MVHFDEHNHRFVEHDQVEFAVAGGEVAGEELEAGAFELRSGAQCEDVAGGGISNWWADRSGRAYCCVLAARCYLAARSKARHPSAGCRRAAGRCRR